MTTDENGGAVEVPFSRSPEEVLVDIYQALKDVTTVTKQLSAQLEQQAAPACAETEEDRSANIVKAFMSLSPPTFKGGYDSVAENWLEEVKKILDVLGVAESRMVSLASYMLRGEANLWWNMVKSTQNVTQFTWEQFEEVFLKRYIRPLTRIRKRTEFNELSQGGLSVAEYDLKFRELSRYETEFVLDENMKSRKFKFGLSKNIFEEMVAFELRTYSEVVEKALLVESVLEEMKCKNYDRSGQDGNKYPAIEQYTEQSEEPPKQLKNLHRCYGCSEVGHSLRNCPLEKCRSCGKQGHANKKCPLKEPKEEISDQSSQDANKHQRIEQSTEQNQNAQNQLAGQVERKCFSCGEVGHFFNNCPFVGQKNNYQLSEGDPMCYKCGELGHFKKMCPLAKTEQENGDQPCQNANKRQRIKQNQNHQNQNQSGGIQAGRVCHVCGDPGHIKPKCPFKKLPLPQLQQLQQFQQQLPQFQQLQQFQQLLPPQQQTFNNGFFGESSMGSGSNCHW